MKKKQLSKEKFPLCYLVNRRNYFLRREIISSADCDDDDYDPRMLMQLMRVKMMMMAIGLSQFYLRRL